MSRSSRLSLVSLSLALLAGLPYAHASTLIDGDAIGPDSSSTDNLGGVAAFETGAGSVGQPAVEISQDGDTILDSMRIIMHGTQSTTTNSLLFNAFNYRLKVWEKANYLSDQAPSMIIDLGNPTNITYTQSGPSQVVPDTIFGESSAFPQSSPRPNYDFQFDLSTATFDGTNTPAFDTPLLAGDYIIAIQANHNADFGTPLLAFSESTVGPIPYFFQDVIFSTPRSILRDQDPNNITIRWAWNIHETPFADFDNDGDVDGRDYLKWQRQETPNQGTPDELTQWRSQHSAGAPSLAATAAVPEPSALLLAIITTLLYGLRKQPSNRNSIVPN